MSAESNNKRVLSLMTSDINKFIGRQFVGAVQDKIDIIEDRMEDLQNDYVRNMILSVGTWDSPTPLKTIGIQWLDLSDTWVLWKHKAGSSADPNDYFYAAFKNRYRSMLSRLWNGGIKKVAGRPRVTLLGDRSVQSSGSISFEARLNRFRDLSTGRFAKRIEIPKAIGLRIDPFPNFKSSDDVIDLIASARNRTMVAAGEYGATGKWSGSSGTWKRPARPFLTGFWRFYLEKQLEARVRSALRS